MEMECGMNLRRGRDYYLIGSKHADLYDGEINYDLLDTGKYPEGI
jgi:hypothetical protein